MGLTFKQLRDANVRRLPTFKNAKGEVVHNADGSDWTPMEWSAAAAGELGEACNEVKKVRRGDYGLDDPHPKGGTVRENIGKEIADVVTYLDILAKQVGVDLGEAIRQKFNEISARVGSDVKL